MRTRVAVIGGGRSCEHDVSLASAASVAAGLDPASYDVVRLTIGRDGTWRDRGGRPISLAGAVEVLSRCDVAFPVVHGPHGEDGTLAALCDLAGIPYVGSGVGAGALAMDKWATKLVGGCARHRDGDRVAGHRGHRGGRDLDRAGRGQAGRRRLEPRRLAGHRAGRTGPGARGRAGPRRPGPRRGGRGRAARSTSRCCAAPTAR